MMLRVLLTTVNHILRLPAESDCDPGRENGVFSQKGLRDSGPASELRAPTGAAGTTLEQKIF